MKKQLSHISPGFITGCSYLTGIAYYWTVTGCKYMHFSMPNYGKA